MHQSDVKTWINVVINIMGNIIHHITLCWEHIVTIILPKYKCILMHIVTPPPMLMGN
jgi:hypothetical protein